MKGPVNPVVNRNLGMPGNDDRHDQRDPNAGGGPTIGNRKAVPPAKRGGFGHHGQRQAPDAQVSMGGARAGVGNPASRGGTPHSFHPDTDNPNSGGAVQVRPGRDMGRQVGMSGQRGVPTYPHANPQPSAGNTSGRMHRRIAGNFTNKTKGAGGNTGKYGGPPVRLDH